MARKKDYSKLSKDELVAIIEKLEKRKKYGLVWDAERVPEKVVVDCKENLPVLAEVKGKEIFTSDDEPTHILIEGDNYHALSVLNYTHQGKIDVIYIDPPYNTGAKDWRYNNNYVEETDNWRHSKWIQFMYNRLTAAMPLLKEDGVMVVTIDDYELPNITVLLKDLGARSLGRVAICIKPEGRRQSAYIMEAHEYALFVTWGKPKIRGLNVDFGLDFPEQDEVSSFRWEGLMRRDAGREDRGSDYWYAFYVEPDGEIKFEPTETTIEQWPVNTKGIERVWLWDRDRSISDSSELRAVIRKGKPTIYYKRRETGRVKPTSFWYGSKYNANAYGTRLLDTVVPGNNFDFPKSVYSVLDCIDLFLPEDGKVLDFFAGSGTTAHATLILNQEDGGSRNFILCTNNENDICESVTYPRIKNVISGYDASKNLHISGIPANLRYFRTASVKSTANVDQVRINITKKCTEMLCLREGIYRFLKGGEDWNIFEQGQRILGVYYNFVSGSISELRDEMNDLDGEKVLYCFTLDPQGLRKEDFADWEDTRLEAIPQKILDVYKQLFKDQ